MKINQVHVWYDGFSYISALHDGEKMTWLVWCDGTFIVTFHFMLWKPTINLKAACFWRHNLSFAPVSLPFQVFYFLNLQCAQLLYASSLWVVWQVFDRNSKVFFMGPLAHDISNLRWLSQNFSDWWEQNIKMGKETKSKIHLWMLVKGNIFHHIFWHKQERGQSNNYTLLTFGWQ